MKLVKESIGFQRGLEPKEALDVGKNSSYDKKQRLEDLVEKISDISDQCVEKVLNEIDMYEETISNLEKVGVDISQISIRTHQGKLGLPAWRMIRHNTVISEFLTKEDAQEARDYTFKMDITLDNMDEQLYLSYNANNSYLSCKEVSDYFQKRGWSWHETS